MVYNTYMHYRVHTEYMEYKLIPACYYTLYKPSHSCMLTAQYKEPFLHDNCTAFKLSYLYKLSLSCMLTTVYYPVQTACYYTVTTELHCVT